MNRTDNDTVQFSLTKAQIYATVIPLMLLLCAITFIANLCILIAMRFIRTVFSPILILTGSLAAADSWAAFIVAFGLLVNSYIPYTLVVSFPGFQCISLTVELLRLGGIMSTILHLLALSVVHYIATAHPIRYRDSAGLVKWAVLMLWVTPPLALVLMGSVIADQAYRSPYCQHNDWVRDYRFRVTVFLHQITPLIIMAILYARIISIVQSNKPNTTTNSINRGLSVSLTRNVSLRERLKRNTRKDSQAAINSYQRRVKATYTSVMILITFMLSWMPVGIWYVATCATCTYRIEQLTATHELLVVWLSIVFNTLMILKGLVNAIIYSLRIPEIQLALKELLKSLSCCVGDGRETKDEISRLEMCPLVQRNTITSLPTTLLEHNATEG